MLGIRWGSASRPQGVLEVGGSHGTLHEKKTQGMAIPEVLSGYPGRRGGGGGSEGEAVIVPGGLPHSGKPLGALYAVMGGEDLPLLL